MADSSLFLTQLVFLYTFSLLTGLHRNSTVTRFYAPVLLPQYAEDPTPIS